MALTKLDPNVIGQDSTGAGKITSAGGSVSIDSSGNVRIANSSANSVTVAANGFVGIGNTAPSHLLTLGGSIKLNVGNAIYVENPGGGRLGALGTNTMGTYVTSHNGFGEPLLLYAPTGYIELSVNGSTCLKVNQTNGAVTTPRSPSFRAARNAGFATTANSVEVVYGLEYHDTTSNYDVATGRFTAPVAGSYFFHAHLQPTSTGQGVSLNFYLNGSALSYTAKGWTTNLPARGDICVTTVISLNAGDYISVYATSSGTCTWDNHGIFCGYLVG